MKEELINVTCANEACSKPLLALHVGRKGTRIESYGALIRSSLPRLGVAPRVWVTCPQCGTETETEPRVAALFPSK